MVIAMGAGKGKNKRAKTSILTQVSVEEVVTGLARDGKKRFTPDYVAGLANVDEETVRQVCGKLAKANRLEEIYEVVCPNCGRTAESFSGDGYEIDHLLGEQFRCDSCAPPPNDAFGLGQSDDEWFEVQKVDNTSNQGSDVWTTYQPRPEWIKYLLENKTEERSVIESAVEEELEF